MLFSQHKGCGGGTGSPPAPWQRIASAARVSLGVGVGVGEFCNRKDLNRMKRMETVG